MKGDEDHGDPAEGRAAERGPKVGGWGHHSDAPAQEGREGWEGSRKLCGARSGGSCSLPERGTRAGWRPGRRGPRAGQQAQGRRPQPTDSARLKAGPGAGAVGAGVWPGAPQGSHQPGQSGDERRTREGLRMGVGKWQMARTSGAGDLEPGAGPGGRGRTRRPAEPGAGPGSSRRISDVSLNAEGGAGRKHRESRSVAEGARGGRVGGRGPPWPRLHRGAAVRKRTWLCSGRRGGDSLQGAHQGPRWPSPGRVSATHPHPHPHGCSS